ncbi:MAG: glycerol-3-phosphate dehydrogenase C-terminal domain-containing protein, partial [Ferrovibrio sp.]
DGDSDPSAITRDYVLDLEGNSGEPPLLSVYGGKLTTSRRLAEHALQKLTPFYPKMGKPWSGSKPLPGGDLGMAFDVFVADLRHKYPGLDPAWLARLARRHGKAAHDILGDAQWASDLGESFGGGLYSREVDYLMRHEWAREADDVLWRRTKCGLWVSATDRERLAHWMAQHRPNVDTGA